MNEFKGTPAPWAVEVMPSGAVTVTAGQFFVAGDGCGLAIENAKLIAVAPEMFAELTVLRDTIPHLDLPAAARVEILRRINAVIAKATE